MVSIRDHFCSKSHRRRGVRDSRIGSIHCINFVNYLGSDEDFDQTLDECVERDSQECTDANQVTVVYLCGTKPREGADLCKVKKPEGATKWGHPTDWNKTARASELAKIHIIKTYYVMYCKRAAIV